MTDKYELDDSEYEANIFLKELLKKAETLEES